MGTKNDFSKDPKIDCFDIHYNVSQKQYTLKIQNNIAADAAKLLQLCPTLCDLIDSSPPDFPPPPGFSRQEHWSGLPFPSPMCEVTVKSESEVAQLCPTLSNPMDCSLPGSFVRGIFQARVLKWVAIAFSENNIRTKFSFF